MPKTKTQIITEKEYDMDPDVKIAVMNNDIKHVNETLTRIESKFDEAIKGFVTTEKLNDVMETADIKHREQDKRIKNLESWNRWEVTTFIAACITLSIYLIVANIK